MTEISSNDNPSNVTVDEEMMETLDPQIRRLLIETNTNISDPRDVEALANVSVRELTNLFNNISQGMTKEKALTRLRDDAIKKMEEKKRMEALQKMKEESEALIQKIQEYDSSLLAELEQQKRIELNELKDGLSADEEQVKAEELTTIQELLAVKVKIEEEEAEIRRAKEAEEERQRQEEEERKRIEETQKYIEEIVQETTHETSSRVQERMSSIRQELEEARETPDAKENDVQRMREALKKLEEISELKFEEEEAAKEAEMQKFKSVVEQSSDEELEELVKQKRQALETLKHSENPSSEEMSVAEEQLLVVEQSLESRIEEAEKERQKAEEIENSIEADLKEMEEKFEEQQVSDDSEDQHQRAEDKTQETEEKNVTEEADYTGTGGDSDDDNSDDEDGSESFELPEGLIVSDLLDSMNQDFRQTSDADGDDQDGREHSYSIDHLDEKKWLCPRFEVTKYNPKARLLSKNSRIWEINFFDHRFNNLSRKGKLKKSLEPRNLFYLQRTPSDNKRIYMRFLGSNHPYELVFKSNEMRERFFECASAIRPSLFSWCPDLCSPGEERNKTVLHGRFRNAHKGSKKELDGSCQVNVTSDPAEAIKVFCGTWNMGKFPPPKDPQFVRQFIPPGEFDVYAIGVEDSGFNRIDGFKTYIQEVLGGEYVCIASQNLWDIKLIIFARKRHFLKIGNIECQSKATGFLNMLGNKGGVAIGLRFNETSMLFVNAHLASNKKAKGDIDTNAESCKLRNQNVQEILDSCKFKIRELDLHNQFHHIFFMGDLNYRIEMKFEDAVKLSKDENFTELLRYDQLREQMYLGSVLADFSEANISFPPTYKYVVGTTEFDESNKKNAPSYTDRVLWKSLPGSEISCDEYGHCEALNTSDQMPVYAHFTVKTLRPYLSIFSKSEPNRLLKIEEVVVSGRDTIISRPHLTFYGEFIPSNESTSKYQGTKTANPKWIARHLPTLKLATSHKDFLRSQYLIVALRDGSAKNESTDNLIGTVALPLHDVVNRMPYTFEYEQPMYRHGVRVCDIMVRMHLME